MRAANTVMAGLDPVIRAQFFAAPACDFHNVGTGGDGRVKPGHDDTWESIGSSRYRCRGLLAKRHCLLLCDLRVKYPIARGTEQASYAAQGQAIVRAA
jgi:hypothetical protein